VTAPYDLASALDGFLCETGEGTRAERDAVARLVVAPTGLRVRSTATGAEHLLPWRGAKLQRRADGALLVRTKRGVAGSQDPDFLRAIEAAVGNELGDQIARLSGERTGLRASGWLGCIVFTVLTVWLVSSIPGCIRGAADSAVESAPFSVDEKLGEIAEGAMDVGELVEDERVVKALEAMVARLQRGIALVGGSPPVTWHVRIVRDETVNAFALPGGYITVFTGLLEAADTPEMVAGVLAHEMAHVTQRHGLRRVGQSLGFFAAIQLVLGDASGLGRIAKEVLTIASVNAYSREQENEADRFGVRFLHAARIDPRGLGEFFTLLKQKYGDVPGTYSWLSTHPQHTERIAAIASEAERLGLVTFEGIEVDWAALRAALER
jgi:Zn-dependent protease with chaperone function